MTLGVITSGDAGAEAAEGGGHALVEAGVKLAVVGHGGVAYHKRVRPGEQADNLLKQQFLLGEAR